MRLPPHSLELERALLGCALLDRPAFDQARAIAKPTDFYAPAHEAIWESMGDVAARGEPIDHITLRSELERRNKLALVGGDEYLLSITDTIPFTENGETYARRIRDLSRHRRLLSTLINLLALGYAPDSDYSAFRGETEKATRAITTEEVDGEPEHVRDVLSATIQEIQDTKALGKGAVPGASTGLMALDRRLGGWRDGNLYIIAGRPGMGKSALVNTGLLGDAETATLFFSIEMPATENGRRMLSAESGIDLHDISIAKLSDDHWKDLARSCERLHKRPLWLDMKTRTLEQIVAKSRRFATKHGPKIKIVIDYLQLVRGDRALPREQQISETTRELKALAKELGCPVIVLSQLNRECEKRADKRPQLSDLRESGAIEQDADAIVFIYRRGYYAALAKSGGASNDNGSRWGRRREMDEPDHTIPPGEDDGVTELIVAKLRGGATGSVRCLFQRETTRFVDLAEGQWDE